MLSKTCFLVIFSLFNLSGVRLQDTSDTSYMYEYDADPDEGSMDEAFTANAMTTDNTSEDYTEPSTEEDTETVEDKVVVTENSNVSTEITTTGNLSYCPSYLCKEHGKCIYLSDDEKFECICDEGFVGARCEMKDMCEIGKNGLLCGDGACVYNENMTRKYCHCFSGMKWHPGEKECKKKEPPCFPNPCENGGSCEEFNDVDFNCICKEGFLGNLCEVENMCGIDENSRRCGNGTCHLNSLHKKLQCKCYDGYFVDPLTNLCSLTNISCEPDPCNGHGVCTVLLDDALYFNCTCEPTYAGFMCQIRDLCAMSEDGILCKNGVCTYGETEPLQYCKCDEGYFTDEVTGICTENRLPCLPNPCNHGGICTSLSKHLYNCTCPEGFTGVNCSLRDRCKLDGGVQFCNGSVCTMDYKSDMFYCTCKDGEYFNYRQRRCEVVDFCPLMKCEKNEICQENGCICKKGFTFDNETGECKADFCNVYSCPANDMLCEESSTSRPEDFKCYCRKGFSFNGIKCVPAACIFPSLNDCDQTCKQDQEGGYACKCQDPFTLNVDNRTCDYEYTENERCINRSCDPGVCLRNRTIERCICPSGFISAFDRCESYYIYISDFIFWSCYPILMPSGVCPDDKCELKPDVFRCACDGKYELSRDDITCIPRRMCAPQEMGFKHCQQKNAICIEDLKAREGYFCKCGPGFSENEAGSCEQICNLPKNQQMCSMKAASCSVSDDYSLTCECTPGFEFEKQTGNCIALAKSSYMLTLPVSGKKYLPTRSSRSIFSRKVNYDELQIDITKSMKLLFENFQTANVLSCKETDNYIQCKTEVQFEEEHKSELKRLNLQPSCMYNESLSTTECLLPPSLILRKSKLETAAKVSRTNFCDEDIKPQLCGPGTLCSVASEGKGFSCKCQPGFAVTQVKYPTKDTGTVIETCKDINECEEDNPCPQNSLCINTIGSYKCICKTGYKSNNYTYETKDQICSEICNPSPCIHGDCRKAGDHYFECRCQAGYGGILCNFEDKSYKAAKANVIIVGAVLGGILLITVILYVVTVMRLRRRKLLEDPNQVLYASEMSERRTPGQAHVTNAAFEND